MAKNQIFKEFNEKRERGNDLILEQDFLPFKRFFSLDSQAYREGDVPAKYKEMMGLVGSVVLKCNDCILYHLQQCYRIGCTKQELLEVLNVALVIGGSVMIPHLRVAMEAVEELYTEQ